MQDLMIDLETLGTEPGAPVISLGAVFFDLKTKQLGNSFYMVLDVSEQIKRGRKPDGDTIKWWMTQEDAAKKVFHEKAKPAELVLQMFIDWYATGGGTPRVLPVKDRAFVWGNGSTFDISIMENLFRDYELALPWGYNKAMDVRTFKRFMGKGEQIKKSGTAHNALDDAISQANYVMENYSG